MGNYLIVRFGFGKNYTEGDMVPFCAKQGVERKISFQDFLSAMLSDYECAYACGLAAKKLNISFERQTPLAEVKKMVDAAIPKDLSDLDYQIANLYKLIAGYELEGFSETPEEIAVLLEMGQKSDFFECSN